MKIHEPPKWFFRSWRIIFGVLCVIAVALDPLFFYVIILIIFRQLEGSKSLNKRKLLTFFVLFQYVPRVIQIFQSWKDPKKRVDKSPETPNELKRHSISFSTSFPVMYWEPFGIFFLLKGRLLAGTEPVKFIQDVSKVLSNVMTDFTYSLGNYTFLSDVCPINPPDKTRFDFGIFLGALQSGVVQSKNFSEKFFHCFWWGLLNLRSGQLYMQLDSSKSEEAKKKREEEEKEARKKREDKAEKRMEMEMKEKKRTIEIWMFKYRLPGEMKRQIMQNAMQILKKKQKPCSCGEPVTSAS
ncbi:cyclic nucleotide-gated ion channel 1 [Quercus suber]|uniref:Cyclic nucleotide-gated ion channel 1 n=1 Tax=Quercus suber TaxID=58331 RepID=A0AAW0L375_QUESU